MTLHSARRRMRHRCTIERDASRGTPATTWGTDAAPNWQPHATDVPCWYWAATSIRSATVMDGEKVVERSERFVMVPVDTDITEDDRIVDLTDRRGTSIVDGPMRIDRVATRSDHKVAAVVALR